MNVSTLSRPQKAYLSVACLVLYLELESDLQKVDWTDCKNGSDPVPDFTSTISANPAPDPIYQGTQAVTCKCRLVHESFG